MTTLGFAIKHTTIIDMYHKGFERLPPTCVHTSSLHLNTNAQHVEERQLTRNIWNNINYTNMRQIMI